MVLAQVFLQCGSFENLEVLYVIYTVRGFGLESLDWLSAWRSENTRPIFAFLLSYFTVHTVGCKILYLLRTYFF